MSCQCCAICSRVGTQTSAQGNILPAGIELGSGVKTAGTPRLMSQGELTQTGKDFDLAIRGEGFFKITLPDGRTLESLYRKREWKEVSAALTEELGPMSGLVDRVKPFFVILVISGSEVDGPHGPAWGRPGNRCTGCCSRTMPSCPGETAGVDCG